MEAKGMFRSIDELLHTLPQIGKVRWIGLRTERRGAIAIVEEVEATVENGLLGDRYSGGPGSKRQVTLIQAEHLPAIAGLLQVEELDPVLLRRNIVVSGVNLLALKDKKFKIGSAILKGTGPCQPCSRMEQNFGPGGYNAVRGHGGITASVVEDGWIRLGDKVEMAARS